MGILEDYGYSINWENEDIVAASNILKNKKASLLPNQSVGGEITKYFQG